jgi:hypothetical protein
MRVVTWSVDGHRQHTFLNVSVDRRGARVVLSELLELPGARMVRIRVKAGRKRRESATGGVSWLEI